MPLNSFSTFQTNTNPFFKYNLKLIDLINGDSSFNNAYRIYTFNQNGSITLGLDNLVLTNSLTNRLNYCIVGGGGGGSGAVNIGTENGIIKYAHGSGGGGGQVVSGYVYICSIDNQDKQETITITIGSGGAGSLKNINTDYPKNIAHSGSTSSISFSGYTDTDGVVITRDSIIAQGGIGGKTLLGGSSGGGNHGGFSNISGKGSGGGGGSDSFKGGYGDVNGGNGGKGIYNKVFERYLGGGGGGGLSSYYTATGISGSGNIFFGGGGDGGNTTHSAISGYTNLGGGGGGGGGGYLDNYDGASGGSGIVILWTTH